MKQHRRVGGVDELTQMSSLRCRQLELTVPQGRGMVAKSQQGFGKAIIPATVAACFQKRNWGHPDAWMYSVGQLSINESKSHQKQRGMCNILNGYSLLDELEMIDVRRVRVAWFGWSSHTTVAWVIAPKHHTNADCSRVRSGRRSMGTRLLTPL